MKLWLFNHEIRIYTFSLQEKKLSLKLLALFESLKSHYSFKNLKMIPADFR